MSEWLTDKLNDKIEVDRESLFYTLSSNEKLIDAIENNVVPECFDDYPVNAIIEQYLMTVDVIVKYVENTKEVVPADIVKPKTAYIITREGQYYECDNFNHTGFYINYAMKYDRSTALKWFLSGFAVVLEDAINKFGFVEFVSDGKNVNTIGADFKRRNYITKAQANVLLDLYEINGIAHKYFEEVEEYL